MKILLLQDPKCGYKLRKIAIAKNVNVTHVPEISAEHKLRAKAMKQAAQVLDSESESDVGVPINLGWWRLNCSRK